MPSPTTTFGDLRNAKAGQARRRRIPSVAPPPELQDWLRTFQVGSGALPRASPGQSVCVKPTAGRGLGPAAEFLPQVKEHRSGVSPLFAPLHPGAVLLCLPSHSTCVRLVELLAPSLRLLSWDLGREALALLQGPGSPVLPVLAGVSAGAGAGAQALHGARGACEGQLRVQASRLLSLSSALERPGEASRSG